MDIVESRDGTSIAFDRAGGGPALVLVGGAFQARAGDPRTGALIEHLSGSFTVYNYDRRGRGDSGDTAPYSVEREIEDLDALVSEAGGSASAFGMSSGCVLLLDAAAMAWGSRSSACMNRRSWWTAAGLRFRPITSKRSTV